MCATSGAMHAHSPLPWPPCAAHSPPPCPQCTRTHPRPECPAPRCSRVRVAVACIKVASQAVGAMPSILFFPLLPFVLEVRGAQRWACARWSYAVRGLCSARTCAGWSCAVRMSCHALAPAKQPRQSSSPSFAPCFRICSSAAPTSGGCASALTCVLRAPCHPESCRVLEDAPPRRLKPLHVSSPVCKSWALHF